jgi:NADH-quinone oxidoreductase subunit A
MLTEYIPLLLLVGFVIVNAIGMLVLSQLVSPQRPTALKAAPYESGMPPLGGTRERFSVKFYLVAMLFIVFDIEVVFLIPWGVAFRQLGWSGLFAMTAFIVVLEVGHAYAWKRGALEWD